MSTVYKYDYFNTLFNPKQPYNTDQFVNTQFYSYNINLSLISLSIILTNVNTEVNVYV